MWPNCLCALRCTRWATFLVAIMRLNREGQGCTARGAAGARWHVCYMRVFPAAASVSQLNASLYPQITCVCTDCFVQCTLDCGVVCEALGVGTRCASLKYIYPNRTSVHGGWQVRLASGRGCPTVYRHVWGASVRAASSNFNNACTRQEPPVRLLFVQTPDSVVVCGE